MIFDVFLLLAPLHSDDRCLCSRGGSNPWCHMDFIFKGSIITIITKVTLVADEDRGNSRISKTQCSRALSGEERELSVRNFLMMVFWRWFHLVVGIFREDNPSENKFFPKV